MGVTTAERLAAHGLGADDGTPDFWKRAHERCVEDYNNLLDLAERRGESLRFFLNASGSELVKECYPSHTEQAYAALGEGIEHAT